jgi:hypothetical protein
MTARVVTLDVREDIRQGHEPFTRILQTAADLRTNETLRLLVPFEPIPLYRMLARQGFTYRSNSIGTGDWEVLFSRSAAAQTDLRP